MKTLNIAIVAPFILGGGLTAHLRETIPRLRQRGHKVILVTSDKCDNVPKTDDIKIYRSWKLPTEFYGFMPSAIFNVTKTLKGCDIIHIHGYPNFLADCLTISGPRHKIPLVITFHGSFHQATCRRIYYLKKLHNKCMLKFEIFVHKFIAVSYAEKNEVTKRGIPEAKVEVVYNGVSTKYSKLRRIGKERSNEKRILFLGRLVSSKNPELLVSAMNHVVEKADNSKLILAGSDWGERKKLENMVSKLGIRRNVKFMGKVTEEEKVKLLTSCDVFVHPTLQDVFSISILEASAAGLPVVAFNVGGNSEMIINEQTGILVNDLNSQALADAILMILRDRNKSQKMGEKGRKYVLKKFSWKKTVDKLEKLYEASRRAC